MPSEAKPRTVEEAKAAYGYQYQGAKEFEAGWNAGAAEKEAELRTPGLCGVVGHLRIDWVDGDTDVLTAGFAHGYCRACKRYRDIQNSVVELRQRIMELEKSLRSLSDEASNVVGSGPDSNLACLERRTAIARALLLPESIE